MMNLNVPQDSALRDPGFVFGVATAAFQIEGADGGRLPSIWDTFCAETGRIRDGSDGSTACDHFNRWETDLDLLSELGVDAYRFSISWSRVMRADGSPNPAGLRFYQRLVDGLNARGIRPFVTLYHWDLPQYLQDRGGWLNRETAYRFAEYADVVVSALTPGVFSWATLNEPMCSAFYGYETGMHAPGFRDPVKARQVAHHLLLAHGLAMRVLRERSPDTQNGIVLNLSPCDAASDKASDRAAAARADASLFRWYLEPVLLGQYPALLQQLPAEERPLIREIDLKIISHPIDYIGINYYSRLLIKDVENASFEIVEPSGDLTDMGWEVVPDAFADLLISLSQQYALPPIYITENGAAYPDRLVDGQVQDPKRLEYFERHLHALDAAMREGVRVDGYFCWSLMDNFEWAEGYTRRFGLYYVDYATQERVLKSSGRAWRDFLVQRREPGPIAAAGAR
jgi:beta-glucosidase